MRQNNIIINSNKSGARHSPDLILTNKKHIRKILPNLPPKSQSSIRGTAGKKSNISAYDHGAILLPQ